MNNKQEIWNELQALSTTLAGIENRPPYTVPEGYFEQLPGLVLSQVQAADASSSLLDVAGKITPLELPAGYFDGLENAVMSRIRQMEQDSSKNELDQLSPLLASIRQQPTYQAPQGYFEALQIKAPAVASSKTVSIFRAQWMRYAAAAAVVLFVSYTALTVFKPGNKAADGAIVAKGLKITTEEQFNQSLAQVDAGAIVSYLAATGDLKDAEDIKSLVDESQLPDETEYLDETFLHGFMKELEQVSATQTN